MCSPGDTVAAEGSREPALAVFHGHGTGGLAGRLRRGFAHVFVAIRHDGYWIVFDSRAGVPSLEVAAGACCDLASHYRAAGFEVVEVERSVHAPPFPLMLATCVGAAKRLLGIGCPWIVTPRQLYRHLQRRNRKRRSAPCADAD